MANWVVGATTFSPLAAAPTGTGWAVGRYWVEDVNVDPQIYDRRRISFPGVDGMRIKKFGSRGRNINGRVCYLFSSYATVFSNQQADRAALENTLFNTTPPQGTQYTNCELVMFPQDRIMHLGDGKLMMITTLAVFSLE